MRRRRVREAVSAGGVVYRVREDGAVELVLVARPSSNLWALPKGTPEPGESIEETALREVSEETGLQVEIVAPVCSIEYSFKLMSEGVRIEKVVHHFLMRARDGDVSLHDHEYDVVDWFETSEALRRMTYANERAVVERAAELIEARAR